jgi:hypothetical protein
MADELLDWPDPRFINHVLAKHPAPLSPVTNEPCWPGAGIRLHGAQHDIVHDRYRFKKVDGGWRGGKSMVAALALYLDGLWRWSVRGVTDDLWGVIGPDYAQAEEEMNHLHKLLEQGGIPHDFHTPQGQSWRITFPDKPAEYRTLTAGDVAKIASKAYRGMVIAEAAQTVMAAWTNARGRVTQTRGWVMMEGTFENQKGPWYTQLTVQWKRPGAVGKRYALPSWDNLVIFPGGRDDPAIAAEERETVPVLFREKFGGEPQPASNVVLPEASATYNVQRRFPRLGTSYDDELPVWLFIDPGIAHAYAVLACQFWASPEYLAQLTPETRYGEPGSGPGGNVCQVIDVVYRWGHETEQVVEEAASRPWARNVSGAVLDFAARQRRAEGPPVIEQWAKYWYRETGSRLYCYTDPVPLMAGYEVHRRALLNAWPEDAAQLAFNLDGRQKTIVNPAGPRLVFDPDAASPMFGGTVDAGAYGGEYLLHVNRRNRQGTVTSDEPVDTDNDAIKAATYGLYWWFGPARQKHRFLDVHSLPFEMVAGAP